MAYFHRWRVRRWALVGLPVFFFLLLCHLGSTAFVAPDGSRGFVADDAYRNLVVAEGLRTSRVYGLDVGQLIPARKDMLWRGLIAIGAWLTEDPSSASWFLGVLFGALTLLRIIRVGGLLFPLPLYSYFIAALLVMAPGLCRASLSGESTVLAWWLVASALCFHLQDMASTGKGLPLRATLCIGLALWLRIEFVVVWFLLWTHSLVAAWLPDGKRPYFGGAFFRGLSHLLICVLLLLPALSWNMHLLNVPWPRWPDVPLAANLWQTEGFSTALGLLFDSMRTGWSRAFTALWGTLIPARFWATLFFLLGYGILARDVLRNPDARPFLLFLLAPWVVPFAFGLIYPYAGDYSLQMIMGAFWFIGWLVAGYAVIRLPFVCEEWVRSRTWMIPEQTLFRIWWGAAVALLALSAMLGYTSVARRARVDWNIAQIERTEIVEMVERNGLHRDRFLTDRPGWLRWSQGLAVMDLQGEWSSGLLPFVGSGGRYDDRLLIYLKNLTPPPGVIVLWDPHHHELIEILPEKRTLIPVYDDGRVLLAIGNWPGVL